MNNFIKSLIICLFLQIIPYQCISILPTTKKCYDYNRTQWDADKPRATKPLLLNPPDHIIVHHTATNFCENEKECKAMMKHMQYYHMNIHGWNDIGYNFVIGEDAKVYEGRGYGIWGAHATSFDSKSLGIAIVGDYTDRLPNKETLKRLKDFLECSVKKVHLLPTYKLQGHRDNGQITECPGYTLYNELRTWDKYSSH
ncbi:hypothetical protein SNEBB_002689 [Seison nebaliae]|nr:hypothetical protein SNEBB_002689 [Seison nebaliae]